MDDYDRPSHVHVECCDRFPIFERTEKLQVGDTYLGRVCRTGYGCQWIDPEGSRP